MRTLNQSAQDAFARLADDFSKDWTPVKVTWKGNYLPQGDENKFPENFLPQCGIKVNHTIPSFPFPENIYKAECSVFGWSYREGIKEGILTRKEKVYDGNVSPLGIDLYPKYVTKDVPCTLKESLSSLAAEMPHLSHFAIYITNEEAERAEFELYKIPKNVFEFNTKM
jgi:hypothetical protein